ncbi:MAG: hypothetical protein ACPL0A_01450 [Candidatus Micrarchaeia archaeon]
MEMRRMGILLAIAVMIVGNVVFASSESTAPSGLKGQLNAICKDLVTILPVVALVMIVLAGLVYAAGQAMGAEMRSRASVWATSLLVGAIIGLILAASAKGIVKAFAGAALFGTEATGNSTLAADITCQ